MNPMLNSVAKRSSDDVFDDIDQDALPAMREGLADCQAGRVFAADEVEAKLQEKYRSRSS